jgi:uncharacterized integral membrane protein
LRYLHWIVTAPVTLFLVIFAVSNRQDVSVTFWPLPIAIETKLFLVVLLAALIGFLAGELVAWLGGRSWRQEARRRGRRIEALERELAATQAELGRTSAAVAPRPPRVPATVGAARS